MPIQPGLALQVKGLELPDPLAMQAQATQIQNALQQQRMGEMQIQNAMREQRRTQELESLMAGFSPEAPAPEVARKLQERGFFQQAGQTLQQAALRDKTAREAQAARFTEIKTKAELAGRIFSGVSDQGSYTAARTRAIQQGLATADEIPEAYDKAAVDRIVRNAIDVPKALELEYKGRQTAAQEATAKATGVRGEAAMISARAAEARAGQDQRGQDLQQQRIDIERERLLRDEKRYDLDQRRVRIAEENQRRQADPEYQQMLERARAAGAAAGKNDQVAAETLPKVITTAEMMLGNIDAMIGKPEIKDPKTGKVTQAATRPHPGFEMTVGATLLPGARFVPGSPAADFQARFDQLKGESFLQAYETLKGGGQITNIEGEKGTQAINRMSLAQSEKEFIDAARELQGIIKKGVERAQSRVRSAEPRSAAPRGKAGEDSNAPAQVKSDADYDKLPSGALFTGPDGVLRRKP
jgi:hypothetical protein